MSAKIMPRKCTICEHKDNQQIDMALAGGDSLRVISNKFAVRYDALNRHKKNHLSKKLIKTELVKNAKQGDSIADKVIEIYNRALRVQKKTEDTGDWANSILAMETGMRALGPLLAAFLEFERQKAEKSHEEGNNDSDLILRHFMHAIHDYPDVKNRLKESLSGVNGNGGSLH